MTTALDLWQQAYALSIITGSAADIKDPVQNIETKLAGYIAGFCSANAALLGDWSTAWGPVVTSEDDYADNAMYVATDNISGTGPTTLLVGIAGTNFNSKKYDVRKEDLKVGKTVLFSNLFKPSAETEDFQHRPRVSAGTAYGIRAILRMTSQGQSLLEFLRAVDNKSTTRLIFAGHSLGGALCPVLAATFFDPDLGGMDSNEWGDVYIYPSAGPSPGNEACAELIAQYFPPSIGEDAYKSWNANVCNPLDIVPCAWNTTTLEAVKAKYSTSPYLENKMSDKTKNEVDKLVDSAKAKSIKGAVLAGAYTGLAVAKLDGAAPNNNAIETMEQFKDEAFYQHMEAYLKLLGIDGLKFPGKLNAASSAVEMLLHADVPARADESVRTQA